jgi:hypothetical protein
MHVDETTPRVANIPAPGLSMAISLCRFLIHAGFRNRMEHVL